ncbi:unnamed protein product, partial [Ectocarpus sp. 12 AP-2014]
RRFVLDELILSIRKVLFIKLARNEFRDHDDNFYMFMRQECSDQGSEVTGSSCESGVVAAGPHGGGGSAASAANDIQDVLPDGNTVASR